LGADKGSHIDQDAIAIVRIAKTSYATANNQTSSAQGVNAAGGASADSGSALYRGSITSRSDGDEGGSGAIGDLALVFPALPPPQTFTGADAYEYSWFDLREMTIG
jgi:hypothetical protein